MAPLGRHVCPLSWRVGVQLRPETESGGHQALALRRVLDPPHRPRPGGRQRGLSVPGQHRAQTESRRHAEC